MKSSGFTPMHILFVVVVFGAIVMAGLFVASRQSDNNQKNVNSDEITNFDECVAAGNPVMESYPEQCAANGKTFTNEKQKVQVDTSEWLTKDFKHDGKVAATIKYPVDWEFKAVYNQAKYKEDAFEILSNDKVTVYALLTTAPLAYEGGEKVYIHKKTDLATKYDGEKVAIYTVGKDKNNVSRLVVAKSSIGKPGQTVTSTELVFGITLSKGDPYFVIYSKFGNTMQEDIPVNEFNTKESFNTAHAILETLSFN